MTEAAVERRIAVIGNLADTQLGFRSELIKDMVAAGHVVFVFATDYCARTEEAIKALGATPVRYKMSRLGLNPFVDLYCTWRLYRLLKKYKIDLTFCSFAKPVIFGTLAAWLAKVPTRIAKIEGLGRAFVELPQGMSKKQRWVRSVVVGLYRFALPKAHKVYVLNADDKHELINEHGVDANIEVLGGIGVCLESYPLAPVQVPPIRFIFVGRLLNEKGIRYYLKAAENIKEKCPEAEFIVLGQPDNKRCNVSHKELKGYVNRGVIHYPGKVGNVVDWLVKSSVFVLPSYYREGVPRSTQEALAVGRAVITTDMPGCRDTVEAGANGFLIPPHDQRALEEAMMAFVITPELATTMGQRSFEIAHEKFDVRKINQRIIRDLT